MAKFNPQALANTARAFAIESCPQHDELPHPEDMQHMSTNVTDVFDAFRERALRMIGELDFCNLASFVWAYSTVRQLDEDL